MARPHDIWEFGWSRPYDDRHAYIQSLPENEQEWATLMFHYIDLAFEALVMRKYEGYMAGHVPTDEVESVRQWAKMKLEPPIDDRWKVRFKRDESYKFFEREENDE